MGAAHVRHHGESKKLFVLLASRRNSLAFLRSHWLPVTPLRKVTSGNR